jgi:hypothetical protein
MLVTSRSVIASARFVNRELDAMPTTRTSTPVTAAALLTCLAALASACSSAGEPTTAATTAIPAAGTPAPSASTSSPAAEALAAYAAMWKDVAEADNTADYQAAYLGDHLAGQALLTITDNMAVEKSEGIVVHGAPVLHPVVTYASVSTVAISDCMADQAWLEYRAATGKLLDDIPGGFRATTATVTDQNGIWKVTQINTGADGTCHLSSPTG